MKIKRFLAPTMREALKAVRTEQGPDAVILSNQRVGDYIEIIAALDYDEALIKQTLGPRAGVARSESSAAVDIRIDDAPDTVTEESAEEQTAEPVSSDLHRLLAAADRGATPAESHRLQNTHITGIELGGSHGLDSIRDELGSLKALLHEQLAANSWQDQARSDPAGAQILRNFARLGIAADVAESLYADMPALSGSESHSWRQPISSLSQALPVAEERLLSAGGIAAFVGPTGVGKTTTIAKIASQYAMQHGPRDIALVSMDSYRIGAQEQLRTFGRIINASVFEAADSFELATLLNRLRDYRLVLIDTEGVSQRDQRLAATLDGLANQSRRVDLYLTLAATVDEHLLDEIVRQYCQVRLAGCVVTKIDEASRLGAPISVAIRHQLPVAYLTDGQRVPDDLSSAQRKRLWLLNRALEYAAPEQYVPAEHLMAQRAMQRGQAHA